MKVGTQTEVNQWIKGRVVLKDVEFSWFDPKTEEERSKKWEEEQAEKRRRRSPAENAEIDRQDREEEQRKREKAALYESAPQFAL